MYALGSASFGLLLKQHTNISEQTFQLSHFRRDVHAWDVWFTQSRIGNNCSRFLPLFTLSVLFVHKVGHWSTVYNYIIGILLAYHNLQ